MSDIRKILSRIDAINEGDVTPTDVKHGLNKQQKSVPQMPALFKPNSISVLKDKTDPAHPAKKYFVGGESVEESMASEDVVSNVKKRLGDYLQDVASAINHSTGLQSTGQVQDDMLGSAVKTITTDDGHEIKIHGNEDDGFRVSIKNRPHSAKFKNLEHAVMACEMYCNRRKMAEGNADYLEEK
jgi:hypothetical protein